MCSSDLFDHLDHEWIIKFVESRIKDPNIIRLIKRYLKGGIIKDFAYEDTEEGSGQGSVCSPILANIYMHYILVWWFEECIVPKLKGYGGLVVYADDFVVCFQYKEEAELFYELLKKADENIWAGNGRKQNQTYRIWQNGRAEQEGTGRKKAGDV